MKNTNSLVGFALIGITCFSSAFADTPTPTVTSETIEGYHDVAWGTSLDSLKSSKNSTTVHGVKKAEAIGIAYLLMNFNEVSKNSTYHTTKNDIEHISNDKTDYLFYDGKFVLAANSIDLKDTKDIQKAIESKYEKKDLKTYTTDWTYSDSTGNVKLELDYQAYQKSSKTTIYLVKASTYNEDQSVSDNLHYGDVITTVSGAKTDIGTFLIYVSADYFAGSDNAWSDYQAYASSTPASTPTTTLYATPTLSTQQLDKQQDLKKVE